MTYRVKSNYSPVTYAVTHKEQNEGAIEYMEDELNK
jgi:hypothetical protein